MESQDLVKDYLAPKIRNQLKRDWDCWTIKAGPEGSGKSTEAIWFCHHISGPRFQVDKHIVYDPNDFLGLVMECKPGDSILLDEGGEAWFNRDFATKINKVLGKAAMQIRERNLNVVICVPRWSYLDMIAIFRHKYMTNIYALNGRRGFCQYMKPQWNFYSKAAVPFWNTMFRYKFPQLPPAVQTKYKAMKREKGEERLQKYMDVVEADSAPTAKGLTIDDIIDEIREMSEDEKQTLRNSRDNFDTVRIKTRYDVSVMKARQIVAALS